MNQLYIIKYVNSIQSIAQYILRVGIEIKKEMYFENKAILAYWCMEYGETKAAHPPK